MKNQKTKILILLSALLILGGIFSYIQFVSAQTTPPDLGLAPVGENLGLPTTDIRVVVARIIRTALGLLGIVAVVLVLYGGFVWMTAGGDEQKISESKSILLNAVIGLAIILSAYAITSFVISKLVEATTQGPTTTGGGAGGGGGNPYLPEGIFYVENLPAGGSLCIRNVHPAITFNKEVDVTSLNGNVVVQTSAGVEYPGAWQLLNNNTAAFVPSGDCGGGAPDCLAPNTGYVLHFKNGAAVRTANGQMSLNCDFKGSCKDVSFTTGAGVDRVGPSVTIQPIASDVLRVGSVVPVVVSYIDDNGVQKVNLSADSFAVGSQAIAGCQKTSSVTINWPTVGIASGSHNLSATGYDWSALNYSTTTAVNLLPPHCFDNTLQVGEIQAGPPACGGECGACSGSSCSNNSQCASGYCDTGAGVCANKMRINGISPLSGDAGTFVSIFGDYFGAATGKVFVGNTEAALANCQANTWKEGQIIIQIPPGVAGGPIRVETAHNASGQTFVDTTNDAFGPIISDFVVNNLDRPNLCNADPVEARPAMDVILQGNNFGLVPGQVFFGEQNATIRLGDWDNQILNTRVPFLGAGPVAVKVRRDNLDSNSIKFYVLPQSFGTLPIISNITPDRGVKGQYITIAGNNFGDQIGRIWFKENIGGVPAGSTIEGSFSFPAGCKNVWAEKQITVKFPLTSGTVGRSYFVFVRTAGANPQTSQIGPIFNLETGTPAPGVCGLSPVSGPVPLPAGAPGIQITGEYFTNAPEVYFWAVGASSTATAGRVLASNTSIVSSTGSQQVLVTFPAAGSQTGPVVVYRGSDEVYRGAVGKISNPQNFTVLNCVSNNNTCTTPNTHCCAVGAEAGLCRPNNELCSGETFSSGYIWRFSTKDIPPVPHVVERCDADTNRGLNLPSPSPSIIWDTSASDHKNVCRSAAITIEFNVPNLNNISRSDLVVNECDSASVNQAAKNCTAVGPVALGGGSGPFVPQASAQNYSYVELNPDASYNTGKWKDNTWYQVALKTGISTGNGATAVNLAKDAPCNVANSAYCFIFKTDAQDCRMKGVIITPYSYWTSILEAPIKRRTAAADEGADVIYRGHGLSTQHCIVMDTSDFVWSWDSANANYAGIFSAVSTTAKVSALANTVGVGLTSPENAVNIRTVATLGATSYAGASPLTIDLNNPEVVDFWPKCLESCTNAEVGVRFNTSMSNRNLPSGPVKLLKCNDENCFDTALVLTPADVYLDSVTDYTVLKIANSRDLSSLLEANTIYKVVLSASTTDVGAAELLWSAARLGDPTTFSKPYPREFSWRFKTKKEDCKISRVEVAPKNYTAEFVNDKAVYQAQPYGSPDACSSQGQKLNSWSVSWNWGSSKPEVATVQSFNTIGANPYCGKNCLRKGSRFSVKVAPMPICGNGAIEAGEDCDPPGRALGCGLDCRRLGNSNTSTCGNGAVEPNLGEQCDPALAASAIGCSGNCLHLGSSPSTGATITGASICGNGAVGSGEDCDLGIAASYAVSASAQNCSAKCLHTGSQLANSWCFDSRASYGGFLPSEFNTACQKAVSRCGDGVTNPDEDLGCDLGDGNKADWCNDFCLINSNTHPECPADSEGCDQNRQHLGSSLLYASPSVCGDTMVGTGEDVPCETNLVGNRAGLTDPWSLATGVGLGAVTGVPPSQSTEINANTAQNTTGGGEVGGKGSFTIACGYTTDAECQARLGGDWGVADNGCCYQRPKLLNVYPGATSSAQFNICPNTAIAADFDQSIDPSSLKNNIIIARGVTSTCAGTEDVTSLAIGDSQNNYQRLPWYKNILAAAVNLFKRLIGEKAAAVRTDIISSRWCAGEDLGRAEVVSATGTFSKIIFNLSQPLAADTDYFVALKDGIRNQPGVSIGKTGAGKPWGWKFITGSKICEVDKVGVAPTQVYLGKAGATSTLRAVAANTGGAQIQSIPGHYSWDYLWQPAGNPFVILENTTSSVNTIAAQNRSGEIDVRAAAKITENKYSAQTGIVATGKSHAVVFLCENPWPPKELYVGATGPFIIFPYEDKIGNNDGFNLSANVFDNTSIPASPSGGYFNFRFYYCADSGVFGAGDDLPYLRPAVQVSGAVVGDSPTSSLKRFIFTNNKNSDAIGAQVFSNPKHLTVAEWFAGNPALGGQGFVGNFQAAKIDGYDALTDGNNIYVDALNVNTALVNTGGSPICFFPSPPAACFSTVNNIYSNIYLFSINADARPETRKVFEQLVGNLRFNTNLTNYGYCGATMDNPGVSTTCQTDLDCSGGEICSAQTDKLKRNYQRLRDLEEIQNLLGP